MVIPKLTASSLGMVWEVEYLDWGSTCYKLSVGVELSGLPPNCWRRSNCMQLSGARSGSGSQIVHRMPQIAVDRMGKRDTDSKKVHVQQ